MPGMKKARKAASPAISPDAQAEKAHACLHAKYRASYPREVAEYHERFGEEPSLGTLIAAEARAECNDHSENERKANIAYAMSIIYGTSRRPHAGHTTRS